MAKKKYFSSREEFYNELVNIFLCNKKNKKKIIMVSGGDTPIPLYETIGQMNLNWSNFQLVLSDERDVNINNSLSNEGSIKKLLSISSKSESLIGLRSRNSKKIIEDIRSYDLSILGMGADGHFASIFPKSNNLAESLDTQKSLVYIDDGYPDVPRFSLSMNEILKAQKIILLVSNAEKLRLIQSKKLRKEYLPIDHLVERAGQKLTLMILIEENDEVFIPNKRNSQC